MVIVLPLKDVRMLSELAQPLQAPLLADLAQHHQAMYQLMALVEALVVKLV
jgi:hypothetical protein